MVLDKNQCCHPQSKISGFTTTRSKHLKPEQILWGAWGSSTGPSRIWGRPPRSGPRPSCGWRPLPKPISMTAPDCCRFLNLELGIASPECWNNSFCDKHWLYNLHYFDDLNAPEAEDRLEWHRNLIHRWIAENPPGTGTGWEPYPTALRIVNWIKWGLSGNGLHAKWRNSLAVQARWLFKHIEWHLPGHHLFANAKALVFAGLFFEGRGTAPVARSRAGHPGPRDGRADPAGRRPFRAQPHGPCPGRGRHARPHQPVSDPRQCPAGGTSPLCGHLAGNRRRDAPVPCPALPPGRRHRLFQRRRPGHRTTTGRSRAVCGAPRLAAIDSS
jgi:hypothetical protein